MKPGKPPNSRDLAALEIFVKVLQVALKIFDGLALCKIIRVLLQVSDPEIPIIPVYVVDHFHAVILLIQVSAARRADVASLEFRTNDRTL